MCLWSPSHLRRKNLDVGNNDLNAAVSLIYDVSAQGAFDKIKDLKPKSGNINSNSNDWEAVAIYWTDDPEEGVNS